MNDLFTVITGLMVHAYETGAFIHLITIPAVFLIDALHGKLIGLR